MKHALHRFIGLAAVGLALLLCGCGPLASMTCEQVEEEVVALSRAGPAPHLLNVYNGSTVSRTYDRLTCNGPGEFSDSSRAQITYAVYLDENGERQAEYRSDN